VVGVVALGLEAVPRREMGVRPVESDLEIAPVLCRTGVLLVAGCSVLGVLCLTSLCALGIEEAVDLPGVVAREVGVRGETVAEL